MARTTEQLLDLLQDRLPQATRNALRNVVAIAEERHVELYLVGGGVRDLLLGGAQVDLDLVVEGDAIALATSVAEALQARVVSHPRFGTAVVRGEGLRLDLAQARTERYQRPGALPTVRPAQLAQDLARRDFAINAMALRLTGPRSGQLIDRYGGGEELRRRHIRVLHDESFRDDATRILRAVRYAGRLGFRLTPATEALLMRDLSFLETISGTRLRHELEAIAGEPRAASIVRLASGYGVLAAIHPALRAGERATAAIERLLEVAPSRRDAVFLAFLLAEASRPQAEGAIDRLALTGRQAEAVRGLLTLRGQEATLARESLRPSQAVGLLGAAPVAAVEAFALLAERSLAAERARRYLEQWRFVRPCLNGRDLEALGVPHGPEIGAALASLLEARLDGRTKNREEEIALVGRMRLGRKKKRVAGVRRA